MIIVSLIERKKDMSFTLNYHYYIINNLHEILTNNILFYENKGDLNLLDER